MASNAAKYLNLPARSELNGIPIGGTIFWVSTAPIPEGFIPMLGQTPSEIAMYPELLKKFPNGLDNTEHDFVRGAGPSRPAGKREGDMVKRHYHNLQLSTTSAGANKQTADPLNTSVTVTRGLTLDSSIFLSTDQYKNLVINEHGGSTTSLYGRDSDVTTLGTENRPRNISAFYIVRAFFPNTNISTPPSVSGNLIDYLDERYAPYLNIGQNLLDNPDFEFANMFEMDETWFINLGFFANRWRAPKVSGKTDTRNVFTTYSRQNGAGVLFPYLIITPKADVVDADGFHIRQDHGMEMISRIANKDIAFSFATECETPLKVSKISILYTKQTNSSQEIIATSTINVEKILPAIGDSSFGSVCKDVVVSAPDRPFVSPITPNHGVSFVIYFSDMKAGKKYRIKNVKAEIGTKSTPFVPLHPNIEKIKCDYFFQQRYIFTQCIIDQGLKAVGMSYSAPVNPFYVAPRSWFYSPTNKNLNKITISAKPNIELSIAIGAVVFTKITDSDYNLHADLWTPGSITGLPVVPTWAACYVIGCCEPCSLL